MKILVKTTIVILLFALFTGTAYTQAKMFMVSGLDSKGGEVSPQWEPEGTSVAFLRGDSFFIYDINAAQPPRPVTLTSSVTTGSSLTRQLAFTWIPAGDHKFVVLISEKNGRLGLYLGQGYQLIRKLLDFPKGGQGVQFSKLSISNDGLEVLYSDNGVLYKISTRAQSVPERLIKANTLPGNGGAQSWGVFNPKHNDVVAFQLESEGREAIYVYHRKLNKIIGVIEGKFSVCHPDWSPDGEKLAFYYNQLKDSSAQADSNLSWKLAYINYNHARAEISPLNVISVNDSIRRKMPAVDFTPICWTPDSKWVIYSCYDEQNNNRLMLASINTGKVSGIDVGDRITVDDPNGYSTSWSMKIIHSDISCACFNNSCYLAFAADVNMGISNSKLVIKEVDLDGF